VIAASPLYRDLSWEEIAELMAGLELRRFTPGQALMIQGAASDGAYIIASGEVSVAARLPGGGETAVAELGPGDLVGEMALLMRGGKRTASAKARGEVEALFMDRRHFEAALHLLRPASLKVLRRLGQILAQRLRAIRSSLRALINATEASTLFRTLLGGEARPPSAFDVRAFLPILPCFQGFHAEEIDAVFAVARVEEAPRSAPLAEEGEASAVCWVVVRGALLAGLRHGERVHQLDILGPGRFAGVSAVLAGAPSDAALMAAEDSTLLALEAARFGELLSGRSALALRLLEAVNADLVLSLTTASNHLTRLTAQARVRDFTENV
jgi:CRP/FNR family cyclic AMP-dependent transcriptional regulator